jgi:prophage tail gpP-like protein
MLRPAFKLQLGSETYESVKLSPVTAIRVSLDMDIPSDSFEIRIAQQSGNQEISHGDAASISLGYGDQLTDIFKGEVDQVEPGVSGLTVTGLNFVSRLCALRVCQTYENQSSGDIVKDLASRGRVTTEDIANGLRFPSYTIDDNMNAYEHIRELAQKCGFDVYATNQNKLVFKKYSRSEPHVIEYGKNIIQIDVLKEKPLISSVVVQGESPSSFKGASTYHWFSKRRVEAVSGNGSPYLVQDPTVRDKDTAEKVAQARLSALSRNISGLLKVVGMPEVALGHTIELRGAHDEDANGESQVRNVEHLLSKNSGFVSLIGWRK